VQAVTGSNPGSVGIFYGFIQQPLAPVSHCQRDTETTVVYFRASVTLCYFTTLVLGDVSVSPTSEVRVSDALVLSITED
jgi:hypothetical protein